MISSGKRASSAEAWTTLGLLSGLNFVNYLDRYVMAAVLVPMQAELGLSDFAGGAAASAFMLGYFVTAPIFGYLGDRLPRRWLMLAGMVVWSAATAATGPRPTSSSDCSRLRISSASSTAFSLDQSWTCCWAGAAWPRSASTPGRR